MTFLSGKYLALNSRISAASSYAVPAGKVFKFISAGTVTINGVVMGVNAEVYEVMGSMTVSSTAPIEGVLFDQVSY